MRSGIAACRSATSAEKRGSWRSMVFPMEDPVAEYKVRPLVVKIQQSASVTGKPRHWPYSVFSWRTDSHQGPRGLLGIGTSALLSVLILRLAFRSASEPGPSGCRCRPDAAANLVTDVRRAFFRRFSRNPTKIPQPAKGTPPPPGGIGGSFQALRANLIGRILIYDALTSIFRMPDVVA
jgi:hypothetical protein